MKSFLKIAFLVFYWVSFSGQVCTKEIVYGKDYYTDPQKAYFQNDKSEVFQAVSKTLELYGYEVYNIDESKGRITSGWRPVEVDSHYFDLFGTKDYGSSDSSYYQLLVDLTEEGTQIKVAVATKVKSIVGRLYSSSKIERQIIHQLEDYLRSPQIEMTNVGVRKK